MIKPQIKTEYSSLAFSHIFNMSTHLIQYIVLNLQYFASEHMNVCIQINAFQFAQNFKTQFHSLVLNKQQRMPSLLRYAFGCAKVQTLIKQLISRYNIFRHT